MALTQMSIYTDLHVYRPVQKNKPKNKPSENYTCKINAPSDKGLGESLYMCACVEFTQN